MSFALNLSFMLTMWSFLLIDAKFVSSCMRPMQCCYTTYCFNFNFFLSFLWVKKVLLARFKPLPDTAVICSVNGFYLLTDDTCKVFFYSLGHSIKIYFSFPRHGSLMVLLLSWVGTFLLWLSLFLIKICSNLCLYVYNQ